MSASCPSRAARFSDEVTGIFTTAVPVRTPAIERHAGERAISAFSDSAQAPFLIGKKPAPRRMRSLARAAPRCVSQRRESNPRHPGRSIRHLHHQRWFEPRERRGKTENELLRRCRRRAALCELLKKFALPSVSGSSPRSLRQAPRAWTARLRASPGIRVSRSGFRRAVTDEPMPRTTKNPPEHLAREGPLRADFQSCVRQDPSHELGMRRRSAQSRSTVRRGFFARVASIYSC
jgi:hypothetical protein